VRAPKSFGWIASARSKRQTSARLRFTTDQAGILYDAFHPIGCVAKPCADDMHAREECNAKCVGLADLTGHKERNALPKMRNKDGQYPGNLRIYDLITGQHY
jgi:hypothetical protein